jgi:hypothetical protein
MIEKIKLKDIKRVQRINEGKKNAFRKLMVEKGYNYRKGHIIISKDNKIIDGNHRYQACLEIFGGNAKINVRRRNISYFMHNLFFILYNLLVVGLFILLMIYLWN